jgi:hypothetical protein
MNKVLSIRIGHVVLNILKDPTAFIPLFSRIKQLSLLGLQCPVGLLIMQVHTGLELHTFMPEAGPGLKHVAFNFRFNI